MASRGGFSSKVWNSKFLQNYIKDQRPLFGYVGHELRNKTNDKIVEEELRKLCITDESIGAFIALRGGRWLGDAMSFGKTPRQIRKEIQKFIAGWPIRSELNDAEQLRLLPSCKVRVTRFGRQV